MTAPGDEREDTIAAMRERAKRLRGEAGAANVNAGYYRGEEETHKQHAGKAAANAERYEEEAQNKGDEATNLDCAIAELEAAS